VNTMQELLRLVPRPLGPHTDGHDFVVVRCYCDFEGHGRASETWEEHWSLTLPGMRAYWKDNTGAWRLRNLHLPASFHGRTYNQVIDQAVVYLQGLTEHFGGSLPSWDELRPEPRPA